MSGKVVRVLGLGRNVVSLPRAAAFYEDALGFIPTEPAAAGEPALAALLGVEEREVRFQRLRLGAQWIELTQIEPPGASYPPHGTPADCWFQHVALVTQDMDAALHLLRGHRASLISHGRQLMDDAEGGLEALLFRDPAGHPVELVAFSPGSGHDVWQHAGPDAVMLGFDHSALTVADLDRSTAFYTALLGLPPTARGWRRGEVQDELDGLQGVEVEVAAMSPAGVPTPHIELACYRHPAGRPMDPAAARCDVAADRVMLQVEDLSGLLARLAGHGIAPMPPGEVMFADSSRAAMLQDPDGHLLLLIE